MLKSMSMHKMDNKGTIKSNFFTLCLVFRRSIPKKLPLALKIDWAPPKKYVPQSYHFS